MEYRVCSHNNKNDKKFQTYGHLVRDLVENLVEFKTNKNNGTVLRYNNLYVIKPCCVLKNYKDFTCLSINIQFTDLLERV